MSVDTNCALGTAPPLCWRKGELQHEGFYKPTEEGLCYISQRYQNISPTAASRTPRGVRPHGDDRFDLVLDELLSSMLSGHINVCLFGRLDSAECYQTSFSSSRPS